jgi:membrane-bound serine protease (ClpP class)
MTAIMLLFITGALLLVAEVMLPGGIAGLIGTGALLAASIITFMEFGAGTGVMATFAALLLVGAMFYAELVWLPRSKFGRDLVVQATIGGQPPPIAAESVIGKTATALTTLAPSGFVDIEGKRYEAYCRSGHVTRGAQLTVVEIDNFRVVVSHPKST